ncbi:MAG TPA: uroporphyrinogen decarboxylase family protein [Spirochaetia bacterium]|nr:uroporphyrinogen decarboxylase family protein [Spirochaetia bacterium]
MTGFERVSLAINHREADRVPKGEWTLGPSLISGLLGKEGPPAWEDEAAARELLGMDLVAVAPPDPDRTAPDPDRLDYSLFHRWRQETDLFVFALIDGPFERAAHRMGFLEFLAAVGKQDDRIEKMAAREAELGLESARRCLRAGAHGVILADDIAYNRGTFIRPALLRRTFLPLWRDQVQALDGVPVFFHSDGNLSDLLPDLASARFHGLHSLEPTAGMDMARIKQEYGPKLCLWGNVDLGWLAGQEDEDEIEDGVQDLLQAAAAGGGYIFGTSSGCLGDDLPPDRVLGLYKAAGKYNRYPE